MNLFQKKVERARARKYIWRVGLNTKYVTDTDSLVTEGLLRDTNMRNEVRFFFRAGNGVTSVLVMLINYQLPHYVLYIVLT